MSRHGSNRVSAKGEVVMTEGGHRRIRSSAVQAYLATRTKPRGRMMSPRQAGIKAGLHDHPDGHFTNIVREATVSKRATKTASAQTPI
jgi:hypothetical protein